TRIERGVSAGRVQSVALRLVCEREREILSFIPKEYWNFVAEFNTDSNKDAFRAKLAKINGEKFEVNNKTDAEELLRKVQAVPAWHVSDVTTAPRRKFAYPPFITSTLQQAASSSLGFSASQTMRIAQQLYEGVDVGSGSIGLITYMRTDSVAVAPEAQNSCRAFIAAEYGSEYVPTAFNVYKSKGNAQEAHEAIRPTDINLTPEKLRNFLDPQQLRLYTLIWRRFVASQMAPANLERTTVEVSGGEYTFRSTATVIKFNGYLRAYNIQEEGAVQDEDDDTRDAAVLAALKQNDPCNMLRSIPEQKFTEPAPRFSEATLIKELEVNGIGRPSTYATIVNTIQVRKYVQKEKGKLIPTDLGFRINDYLVESLPELFQVGFTAMMEDQLDEIGQGEVQWTEMIGSFYDKFSLWLNAAKGAGAPETLKADSLIALIHQIKNWEIPERSAGKRAFDDRKFFASIENKYAKDGLISGRQWEALLTLALKYENDIPELRDLAARNGFAEDLADADEKRLAAEQVRNDRKAKRIEAEAAAPDQTGLPQIFEAMSNLQWAEPEKRRGRIYDDGKFFDSLKKQCDSGKSLSEKQIVALGKMIEKYQDQIPAAAEFLKTINAKMTVVEDPAADEKAALAKNLIAQFDKVTKWAEPVRKGRRVYDDREFVKSIANHLESGKVLSDKQIEALKKMAAKYSV
ncbi:MAG: type I DNA topoisomerase, partial [Lentisphaeria bacterium]|nr:type I DNA topoisomerase [Lentisphaeria bacterium]